MGYAKQTLKGISWTATLRYSSRILAVIEAAVLARFFLTPYEFGLFGIASLVLAFLEIVTETGINVFLVQKRDVIDNYIDSAWIVSILRGVLISVCLIVFASVIVSFYNAPKAYSLLLFISIVPFVRGFINPAIIRFQKELAFHKEFYLRFVIMLVDFIITVTTAYLFRSAFSLVYGLLAGAVTEVMLSFIFIRPLPSFAFNLAKVKEVIHHGKWVTLYGLFAYFAQESDDIVVGKVLGLSPLGSYQIAYNFGTLPITEITEVVQKVIFPTYAGIADNKKQLRNAFIKTSGILSLLIICMGLFIYFFAGSIVSFILGMRWVGIVPVLRLLIIYGTIRAISGLATPLFLAVGKQRTVAAATFLRFLGLVITIIPFLSMYGINGAGYASIVSAVCELPVMLYYVRKELA